MTETIAPANVVTIRNGKAPYRVIYIKEGVAELRGLRGGRPAFKSVPVGELHFLAPDFRAKLDW